MIDVSFTGATIVISADAIGSTTITEFYDEGSPLQCSEIEVTGNSLTLNGTLVTWAKPSAYVVSVTVVPESENDNSLRTLLEKSHVKHASSGTTVYSVDPVAVDTTMTIKAPGISMDHKTKREYTFSAGRILSGPSAISANAEGKLSGNTYTFIFERFKWSGNGTSVTAQVQ